MNQFTKDEKVETIGTGQLLFQSIHDEPIIRQKIAKQLALCQNSDETKFFRIDWKIICGKKSGQ